MPRFPPLAFALLASAALAQELPTEAECREFAEEVESTIADGDPDFLNRHLDVDAMVDEAMRTHDAPADLKKGFRTGVKKGPKLGDTIVAYLKLGGSYKFLRVRDVKGTRRVLFRKILQGGVDFHEIVLSRKDGEVMGVNLLMYATGEYLSDAYRRGYLVAAAAVAGADDKTLKDWAAAGPILTRVNALSAEGRSQEAWDALAGLPESLGTQKWVMVMKVSTAGSLDEKTYIGVMEEMARLFPGDPALDLMCIDSFFLQKKYKEAAQAVERLEGAVGGDSYLAVMRARMLFFDGDHDKAKAAARAAIKAEPDLGDGYWLLVEISLKDKAFADTVALLDEIEATLELEIAGLELIPEYAEFVKSEEYKKWMEGREE
ncbi:MAG: hypothetical protein HYY18_10905 [Planctomycetes bacterium]|nr:hypothetical protein [Planctomycetota bacterium]